MYARGLQEVEARLVELHRDEIEEIGLSALALVASLVMTVVYPPLVVPLFAGGVAMGALGMRALWRHWDLVDRLADDRDAYAIPAVREYAARDARMERRLVYAAQLRSWSCDRVDPRMPELADDFEQLARALEDERLDLDPACAVTCRRLLTDGAVSPLVDRTRTPPEIRSAVDRIRAGFHPREG